MEIFYLLPKLVGYAATLAALVLLVMLWWRTRIAGYAVLAALMLVGRAYGAWAIPYMATHWLGWQLYDAWVHTALALGAALAWWNIYTRTARPRPGA
ncbi:hypothetical protein ACFX58_11080 [Sphingomonas sp. NCPPB 2930]